MTTDQELSLSQVKRQWDDFYFIGYDEIAGVWFAQWRVSLADRPINVATVAELRERIQEDYYSRNRGAHGFDTFRGLTERMST